ncbi:phosphatidylserine decarboxylase [Streptomyces sp. NBC_01429]|uniref:phosphatidylserine decarboxylase n=1 Tax=Streptomyces sp. NBC_01429 TaxID=2903862 RepID=UPI002E29A7B0|nr:phosphatidylserine decarboxylase [Streptomyces sp. NBC_01429]
MIGESTPEGLGSVARKGKRDGPALGDVPAEPHANRTISDQTEARPPRVPRDRPLTAGRFKVPDGVALAKRFIGLCALALPVSPQPRPLQRHFEDHVPNTLGSTWRSYGLRNIRAYRTSLLRPEADSIPHIPEGEDEVAQNDEPFSKDLPGFIEKIERWYAEDFEGFRTMYDAATANVVPYPGDTPVELHCDWKGQGITFLCDFFTEWYEWMPGVHTGLNYIEKFSWLNYENPYGMVFVTCGPGHKALSDFTHLQGMQMDEPDSTRNKELIDSWERDLGEKKMKDFEPGPWSTFNDFFVRELAPGARPIAAEDDPTVVVAPADCVINMIVDDLKEDTPIPVKSVTMNVRQLLADSPYAHHFLDGTAVSCILMPDSYHWYHTPVAGELMEGRDDIAGSYYGMRDFPELLDKGDVGYGYDYEMFDHFRRGYVIIKTRYPESTESDPVEGYVGMVTVGLNSIASVNYLPKFKNLNGPVKVAKGEKIGNFKYGGSLNILLFQKDRFPALQMLQGQRIGVLEQVERTNGLFTGSSHTHSRRRRLIAP